MGTEVVFFFFLINNKVYFPFFIITIPSGYLWCNYIQIVSFLKEKRKKKERKTA